jgi:hypothetical protein
MEYRMPRDNSLDDLCERLHLAWKKDSERDSKVSKATRREIESKFANKSLAELNDLALEMHLAEL